MDFEGSEWWRTRWNGKTPLHLLYPNILEVSFVGLAEPFPRGFLPSAIFINIFRFNKMSNRG
jgi:hypothetical protein